MVEATQAQSSEASGSQQTSAAGAASQTTAATAAGSSQSTQTQATAPTRPDWVPETAWKADKGFDAEAYGKHYTDTVQPQLTAWAAEQVRRNALPQKADDVKLELPKDFALPQGVEFKFDPAKPEYSKFRELAVKRGLDQDTITDLMGVYAETQVSTAAQLQAAVNAELTKLGSNAVPRVTAINTFLAGIVGAEAAKALGTMMVSADIVKGFESLIGKFSSQGVGSFSQQHRAPQEPQGRVSEEEFGRMTPAARLDYTRKFDQKQFQTNGSGA